MNNIYKFVVTSTALSNKTMSCLKASHASISGKKPDRTVMNSDVRVVEGTNKDTLTPSEFLNESKLDATWF